MTPAANHTSLLALSLVLASGLACGGGSDESSSDPDGFPFEAARHCTDIVNGVDFDVVDAGLAANLEVIEASITGNELEPATTADVHERVSALLNARVAARDEMAELDADDESAEAWAVVVAASDPEIDLLQQRTDLLAAGDWAAIADGYGTPSPPSGETEAALADLQLAGRDCEVVAQALGNPPAHAEFLTAASSACTTIVSRRLADGYSTDRVLDAVVEQTTSGAVDGTPELIAELEVLAEEWRVTADELNEVPTDDVTDAAEWQATLDAAEERADVYAERQSALEAGDADAIERLFSAGSAFEHPGFGDLDALGLASRDCRTIQA